MLIYPLTKTFGAWGAWLKSLITLAPIAPNSVNATPIFTDSWLGPAFIFIHTAFSIRPSGHPGRADAHEGANQILTHHASGFAVMETFSAFIQIFAHLLVFPEGVANWASAFVGPKGVHAAESTEQWVLGTLIDIWSRNRNQVLSLEF